jgi:hypothetical protein
MAVYRVYNVQRFKYLGFEGKAMTRGQSASGEGAARESSLSPREPNAPRGISPQLVDDVVFDAQSLYSILCDADQLLRLCPRHENVPEVQFALQIIGLARLTLGRIIARLGNEVAA